MEIITKLAGVTFGDAQENIKLFGCRDILTYAVIREPDNPYDSNAIRISLFDIWHMGYVPKQIAKDLAPQMDAGKRFLAYFISQNKSPYHDTVGMIVRIVELPEKENEKIKGENKIWKNF